MQQAILFPHSVKKDYLSGKHMTNELYTSPF